METGGAPKGSEMSVLNSVCYVWWSSKMLDNVSFDCSKMSVLNSVCYVWWGSKRHHNVSFELCLLRFVTFGGTPKGSNMSVLNGIRV